MHLSCAAGKPPAPVINKVAGGEKVVGLELAPPQTVTVAGVETKAMQPAQARGHAGFAAAERGCWLLVPAHLPMDC